MARVKSLNDLGKGAWKIASVTPLKPKNSVVPTQSTTKKSKPDNQVLHNILWDAIIKRWPTAVREADAEVPDRKFRIDIALLEYRLGIEIDGWQWHGRYLEDFKRDRRRQNLLVIQGWRVLRFSAADIRQDIDGCMAMIELAVKCGKTNVFQMQFT